ncbi:hypothetical protein FSP39_009341 [Pinctada imbricata]|uniref:Secreted protein n=1 Tax=Pinctada imbricata TaxID=66713 RepID=A0AA88Y5Y2_PINIB|nr:hypothetical protein FSP39_009341 [Pinctada imbricata]
MEKVFILLVLCLTPFVNCIPLADTSDSDSNSNLNSVSRDDLADIFGYHIDEALDTAVAKTEQHDMEIEQLQQEIGQISDALEAQSLLLGKLQDLMQAENEDSGYLDDAGSEEIDSDEVQLLNPPPPIGTQNPPRIQKQMIEETQESLDSVQESLKGVKEELSSQESQENTSEPPEQSMEIEEEPLV